MVVRAVATILLCGCATLVAAHRIVVAPAAGQLGLATLGLLRKGSAEAEFSDMEVCAFFQSEDEMAASRMDTGDDIAKWHDFIQ